MRNLELLLTEGFIGDMALVLAIICLCISIAFIKNEKE